MNIRPMRIPGIIPASRACPMDTLAVAAALIIRILGGITGVLADYEIGVFAVSTYNTDYILVKEKDYKQAVNALSNEAYQITE